MAGEWNGTKPGDERGDQCKDAAFQCELNRCRQSEGNEAADAREVDVDGSSQKFSAVFSVVPQQIANKHRSHIKTRDSRGPARTNRPHRRHSPFAIDQNPVAKCINHVRADQREGHRPHHVHGLQAATHREIEKQGQQADGQRLGVGNGEG